MDDINNQKPSPSPAPSLSPEELVSEGEQVYFEKKDELETDNLGQFAVIEVESKEIFVDKDKLTAIQKAQQKYPNSLFYIVEIGNLKRQSNSEINEIRKYGWSFRG